MICSKKLNLKVFIFENKNKIELLLQQKKDLIRTLFILGLKSNSRTVKNTLAAYKGKGMSLEKYTVDNPFVKQLLMPQNCITRAKPVT